LGRSAFDWTLHSQPVAFLYLCVLYIDRTACERLLTFVAFAVGLKHGKHQHNTFAHFEDGIKLEYFLKGVVINNLAIFILDFNKDNLK
jgi:hypothetical protein